MSKKTKLYLYITLGVVVLLSGSLIGYTVWDKATDWHFEVGDANSWTHNEAMMEGSAEASQTFYEYTDLFCPYCGKFSLVLRENQSEFESEYLNQNKFRYELVVTDILTDGKDNPVNSHMAGTFAYCAANQNKFWEFYNAFLDQIDEEFWQKGIGHEHDAPMIPYQNEAWFYEIAKNGGLDASALTDCYESGEGETQLANANAKAVTELSGGLPDFHFGAYQSSGFNGDWDTVKQMFDAGLAE